MAATTLTWRRATGTDVEGIVALSQQGFAADAQTIWTVDPQHFAHELTVDIVHQFFNPTAALVAVSEQSGQLQAYVWAERNQRTVWSSEEMVAIKIVHVDLGLPIRERIRLIREMMQLWEAWARTIGVNIVVSSTMRGDQPGFIRLHQQQGYECRGSICYLRLDKNATGQVTSHT